ncbi:MAG TPA: hypothetical protein IAC52_01125 [Candidatus Enteromonas pullicola]|uniref:Uncharacterized protein n=1 Tax=Candidatus Alloenteromonas pullicola TaxID=2840784 RepID=A0A9D1S2H5_9FIRM|nr:hypothetical protein [Candidatus Enteromonas pullicola]
MSDAITLQFKGLSNRQKSLLVGALYRQSLVQVGKSPDYHLRRLDEDFIEHLPKTAAGKFLRKVKSFYGGLDPLQQEVFVNECLEHGRHYKFWYMPYFRDKEYLKELQHIFNRVDSIF